MTKKITFSSRAAIWLLAMPLLFSSALAAAEGEMPAAVEEKPEFTKEILFEKPVELPSAKINAKVIRVTFPDKFKTPWHIHPGPGPRYVLKGTVKITEGGVTNTYSAGQVFWESGIRMQAENIGEGPAQVVIFELAPGE
ncbi:MAG: cupin domain-containing protein [Pseudomonadota bacterium]